MCDILYPCGGETKASTSFTSNYNSLQSQTSNFIKANSSETASSVMMMNSAKIEIGGDILEGCVINQDASINIKSETSGKVAINKMDDLRSLISNGMSNALQQASEGTSSSGGAGAASQDNVTINQQIQSIVNTTVSDTNYTKLVSDTLAKNDGVIRIKGSCKGATINQKAGIVADVIAKNVLEAVAQEMMMNEAISTSVTTSSQTAKATSKGFAEMITSFFKGLGGLLPWGGDPTTAGMFFVACCCLSCILVIAAVFLMPQ